MNIQPSDSIGTSRPAAPLDPYSRVDRLRELIRRSDPRFAGIRSVHLVDSMFIVSASMWSEARQRIFVADIMIAEELIYEDNFEDYATTYAAWLLNALAQAESEPT